MVEKKPIVHYNPSLDNVRVPQIALEKVETAKETLRKYPFPANLKKD